jgi:protein-histidine pros-kinase
MRQLVRVGRQKRWKSVEAAALRSDGARVPIEISLHRSRVGGKKFLTGVVRDITQRKFGEFLQQKAIADAESANRAKSDFLANISHEIRTPLNSIVGLTEILRDTRLDPDQRDMLTSVWSSSESLLHLINDLLDFSKIEAGQVDIESVEFDPVALGEQVVEIVRLRASRKGIALYFIVEPPTVPTVIGDVNRIRQILINLLVNASKFTERGSISLRLQWKILQRETPQPGARDDSNVQLRFLVEDTGIGIPANVQARIFQKFFRVDTPVGRRAGGAGLGLSISSLLCDAMGGKIELDSTVGQGSKFTFTLKLKQTSGDHREHGPACSRPPTISP